MIVIERNCNASKGDIVVALDQDNQNTLKRYDGYDSDKKCQILKYENKAKYLDEVIEVKRLQVHGVARHIIKIL